MLAVDEDLWNRGASGGAPDHFAAPCRFLGDVDVGEGNALLIEQHAGSHAVGAERRRVHLDFGHRLRHSRFGSGDYAPVRDARASVSTPIHTAPARFSIRAHSSTVAPVVITSSMITTRFPTTLRRRPIAKAPPTLRSRAVGPR